jgi:hypothetical protein
MNNGELSAIKAMPQKDSTTNGDSSFEMNRAVYSRTNGTNPVNASPKQVLNMLYHPQVNTPILIPAIINPANKKWMGNRDASSIIDKRRNTAVGLGTLNASNKPFGFTTHKDINTTSDALTRVRAGGSVAPPKKSANKNNGLTPTFSPAFNKSVYGNKSPYLFH